MNFPSLFHKIKPWLRPGLTCALGALLLLHPASITAVLAKSVGFLLALVGAALLVCFFSQNSKDFLKMIAGVVLLPMGFSVIQNPMTLVTRMSRFIGIIVLLYGLRGALDRSTPYGKPINVFACVVGAVLLLMPQAIPNLIFSLCGVVLLLIGLGMILDQKNAGASRANDDIVDAR